MILLGRYPKEITLRDKNLVTLRPMIAGDAESLWSFLRQLPEIDKAHFHEDVDRREGVERWAKALDYGAVLPILGLRGDWASGAAPP